MLITAQFIGRVFLIYYNKFNSLTTVYFSANLGICVSSSVKGTAQVVMAYSIDV